MCACTKKVIQHEASYSSASMFARINSHSIKVHSEQFPVCDPIYAVATRVVEI